MKPLCGKARETPGNILMSGTTMIRRVILSLPLDSIAFYQFLDLKKEGEQCGYPPNGTVCAHDHVYGICEEGLFCQIPWIQMCVPGICTKNETGKQRQKLVLVIKFIRIIS